MPGFGVIIFVALLAFVLALLASELAADMVARSARQQRKLAAAAMSRPSQRYQQQPHRNAYE